MPASGEFVDSVADYLVASGVGARYATSGTSLQVNVRRETGAPTTVLLTATGGLAFPKKQIEQYAFQALVDSTTVSGATIKAREVFDLLHDVHATTLPSGHEVLWMRATALPQPVPIGPGGGQTEQYQFSVNFDALLKLAGGS